MLLGAPSSSIGNVVFDSKEWACIQRFGVDWMRGSILDGGMGHERDEVVEIRFRTNLVWRTQRFLIA